LAISPEMKIATVFIGGGTPTLLSGPELKSLLDKVRNSGQILPDAEITVEGNPGTLSPKKLEQLRTGGINRLSLGVQSGEDRFLKRLGRIHTVRDAEEAFASAREAGFSNINMDLIFGLPGQTAGDWEKTLRWAVEMNPEHLSCYCLQLEAGTPLAGQVAGGSVVLPGEDVVEEMYYLTMDLLSDSGYYQYEISNFARKDYECRHNLYYWRYRDYLGIGAAAYSFQAGERRANEKAPDKYIDRLNRGATAVTYRENIPRRRRMAEMIMLGFRLESGPDAGDFFRRWGVSLESILEPKAEEFKREGFLECKEGSYRLTRRGKLVSNRILGGLLASLL